VSTTLTDEALVLRRHRYAESSLVTHVLTRSHGRVHLLAKGAYRPKSAFSGVIDLFDTLELTWSPNRRSELQVLKAGRPLRLRRPITRDLERYRRSLAVVELTELAARPEHTDSKLFSALERALDRFAAELDPGLTELAFSLQFLEALGLEPALEHCAACGKLAPKEVLPAQQVHFSAESGGCLCRDCAREARASGRRVGRLPMDVLHIAHSLRSADSATLGALGLAPETRSRVRDFVERFLEYHLEARPRSRRSTPDARRAPTRTTSR